MDAGSLGSHSRCLEKTVVTCVSIESTFSPRSSAGAFELSVEIREERFKGSQGWVGARPASRMRGMSLL